MMRPSQAAQCPPCPKIYPEGLGSEDLTLREKKKAWTPRTAPSLPWVWCEMGRGTLRMWLLPVRKGLLFAMCQREVRQRKYMVVPENSLEMTNLPGTFYLSHEINIISVICEFFLLVLGRTFSNVSYYCPFFHVWEPAAAVTSKSFCTHSLLRTYILCSGEVQSKFG